MNLLNNNNNNYVKCKEFNYTQTNKYFYIKCLDVQTVSVQLESKDISFMTSAM